MTNKIAKIMLFHEKENKRNVVQRKTHVNEDISKLNLFFIETPQ